MPQSALDPIKYSKNKIHCELYDFVGIGLKLDQVAIFASFD